MKNWNRDTWVGAGVLAVIAVLIIWYVATHPAPVHAPAPGGQQAGTSTDQSIEEHQPYYDVSAVYPGTGTTPLAALPDSAEVNAIALMKQWETDTIATFKSDSGVTTLTPDDVQIQGLGADRKYALGITYTGASSARTVTFVYQVYEDTLGAHPNAFYKTFTFDTATGQNLALSDLFFANAPYLGRLSDQAKTDMPSIIAAAENVSVSEVDTTPTGMLMSGITPTEDNFANFVIDGTDLVIIFQPYQIGPWALGTQVDRIPLSKLADILKPEYKAL